MDTGGPTCTNTTVMIRLCLCLCTMGTGLIWGTGRYIKTHSTSSSLARRRLCVVFWLPLRAFNSLWPQLNEFWCGGFFTAVTGTTVIGIETVQSSSFNLVFLSLCVLFGGGGGALFSTLLPFFFSFLSAFFSRVFCGHLASHSVGHESYPTFSHSQCVSLSDEGWLRLRGIGHPHHTHYTALHYTAQKWYDP